MRAPFQVLVIPYRRTPAGVEYAVLRRSDAGWWQFVAGGGEDDEAPPQAALRETCEEIGVGGTLMRLDSMTTIPKSHFAAAAAWGRDVYVIPEHSFALDVGDADIRLSREHSHVRWVSYEQARVLLQWDSNRTALWELVQRLKQARAATCSRPCGCSEARAATGRLRITSVEVTTRPATAGDKALARALHHAAYRDVVTRQFGSWDETVQDGFFDKGWDPSDYRIILADGEPCGFTAIIEHPDHVQVRELVVHPDWQNRGIGSRLLGKAIETAKARHVPVRLRVLHENRAIRLYERFGFRRTGGTETHVEMERPADA